jgi:hypothetical protein
MRKIILVCLLCLLILLPGVCRADKPLGNFTKGEAIGKYLAGRDLDPMEGIWTSGFTDLLIIKTALLPKKDPKDDSVYTAIKLEDGESNGKLIKTGPNQYGSFFVISPTAIFRTFAVPVGYSTLVPTSEVFIRIYPAPQQ